MGIRGKLLSILLMLTLVPLLGVGWLVRSTTNEEQWQWLGGLFALTIVLSIGISIYFSRRLTRPLNRLSEAAKKVSDGDLSVQVDVSRHDELGDLADAFNAMVPRLQEHMQVKATLGLAQKVQKNLLPKQNPDIPGYDIAGFNAYCEETGGDYYDFLQSPDPEDDRVGVVVGDVSGHGVASALLMATVRGAVWGLARYETNLGEGVGAINNQLVSTTSMGRFMTLFCLVFRFRSSGLQWVNAGHDPALIYTPESDTFTLLEGEDIPLGIEAEWKFKTHGMKSLPPGALLFIGTDGIWETRNERDEEFGKDRYKETIRRNADKPAADICEALHQELIRFRGATAQRDDITLVVVKHLP